jgi:hypothetical protein
VNTKRNPHTGNRATARQTKSATEVAAAKRVQPVITLFKTLLPYFLAGESDSELARRATRPVEWDGLGLKTPRGERTWQPKAVNRIRKKFAPMIHWLTVVELEHGDSFVSQQYYSTVVAPLWDSKPYLKAREEFNLPRKEWKAAADAIRSVTPKRDPITSADIIRQAQHRRHQKAGLKGQRALRRTQTE